MSESSTTDIKHYDLCIVGAGIAGLNAAFVATKYLPVTARVLLLDKHQQAGGMWNDAYPYVRLHQPYQFFTAGNIPWSLGRERSYLATRDEVSAHLRHCFDVISKRLDIDARWGWEWLNHTEEDGRVTVTARDSEDNIHSFTADRFIDAIGFDIETIEPLQLASSEVRSISPRELQNAGLLSDHDQAPVWVVGSGKTAMDTVVAIVRANPARQVGLVTGTGTYFFSRDLAYPTGARRWTGGSRPNAAFTQVAGRFDGTNAAEVCEWFRTRYCLSPIVAPRHNLFGILSEGEKATVTAGVRDVVRDHLIDVVDEPSGPAMLLRSGARHPVAMGSWVVNCTGHFALREVEHKPYVSSSGKSMSVNPTSMTLGFSSVSAYFMTHLFFLDRLAEAPLYELDSYTLRRIDAEAGPVVLSCLIMHNLSVVFERVPLKVFQENGLDFDRWYPPHRRLAGQLQFMRKHKRDRQHHRRALDAFSQRVGVRCGPLPHAAPARAHVD